MRVLEKLQFTANNYHLFFEVQNLLISLPHSSKKSSFTVAHFRIGLEVSAHTSLADGNSIGHVSQTLHNFHRMDTQEVTYLLAVEIAFLR